MTKQNLETEYCNERGDSSFNDYNNNDYTKWLETKLIETEEQLILSGVVSTLCWHSNCKNIKMDAHFACEKHYKEAMSKT